MMKASICFFLITLSIASCRQNGHDKINGSNAKSQTRNYYCLSLKVHDRKGKLLKLFSTETNLNEFYNPCFGAKDEKTGEINNCIFVTL